MRGWKINPAVLPPEPPPFDAQRELVDGPIREVTRRLDHAEIDGDHEAAAALREVLRLLRADELDAAISLLRQWPAQEQSP